MLIWSTEGQELTLTWVSTRLGAEEFGFFKFKL